MPSDHMPHPEETTHAGRKRPAGDPMYSRIPEELRERIEAHREAMQGRAEAGAVVTLAGAIRNLIEKGLDS